MLEDIDDPDMDDEQDNYVPGWCPWCGDPDSFCLCGGYPKDEDEDEITWEDYKH